MTVKRGPSESHVCLSFTVTHHLLYSAVKEIKPEKAKHVGMKELRRSTSSKTAGEKNPISKHQILKSVHRVAERRHAGESVNMTEMIHREGKKTGLWF